MAPIQATPIGIILAESQWLLATDRLIDSLQQQIALVTTLASEYGLSIEYIKPHGALYHDLSADGDLLQVVIDGMQDYPLAWMLFYQVDSPLTEAIPHITVPIVWEAFADRAYQADGLLCARHRPQAVFDHPKRIVQQVRMMIEHRIIPVWDSNTVIPIDKPLSICLHGDNPASVQAAPEIARYIHHL